MVGLTQAPLLSCGQSLQGERALESSFIKTFKKLLSESKI
jgi:hypothetical protein